MYFTQSQQRNFIVQLRLWVAKTHIEANLCHLGVLCLRADDEYGYQERLRYFVKFDKRQSYQILTLSFLYAKKKEQYGPDSWYLQFYL